MGPRKPRFRNTPQFRRCAVFAPQNKHKSSFFRSGDGSHQEAAQAGTAQFAGIRFQEQLTVTGYTAVNDLFVRIGVVIVKVDGNIIVDESTSTVYNPVTNTTNNYTSWVYDYSDRSYNLTLESGDTMTVTYGDEYVTINEGDTVYNVYYLIPSEDPGGSGGSGDTGDSDSSWLQGAWSQMMDKLDQILKALGVRGDPASDCQHTYEDHVDRQPTCAEPGCRTYTCTQCGHTYTEIIDATGHDWVVTNSVPEVVDSEGNVVEKGYDELTCSVCGAHSRDYGDGPEEQDIFDALGDLIAGFISWTLEKITEFTDSLRGITDIFNSFVEKASALGGGFPAFFGAFVALIPEDLQMVLWFAVVGFVVVCVWKKWSS